MTFKQDESLGGYLYRNEQPCHMQRLLLPPILKLVGRLPHAARILDVGCGNGALCRELSSQGFEVVGVDPSPSGVAVARQALPEVRFEVMQVQEDLLERLQSDPFDAVISTEVIEHVYDPRTFVKGCWNALKPGGSLIVSTPYHGYLKNLLIALAGKWDAHADPMWDGGHIKLWSRKTLTTLLSQTGFEDACFYGVGRVPFLWMSMVLAAQRP